MKDYLICIDSDGCAIDSMEIKHRRAFGPCLLDVWPLEPWREEILRRWNDLNLYTMTRGINRFLGLEAILTEIHEKYLPIPGLDRYRAWCRETSMFSNDALEAKMRQDPHPIFAQALEWSHRVNETIRTLGPEIRPFPGVLGALEMAGAQADIAIISSANPGAVQEEWTRFGFMPYVRYIMAQDAGTKADCIGRLTAQGYPREQVLMIGDAPGDAKAAQANGVWYFPILAGREPDSWRQLTRDILPRLFSGCFDSPLQEQLLREFHNNLCPKG